MKHCLKFSIYISAVFLLLLTTVNSRNSIAESDVTAPTSTLTQLPSSPDGQDDWYVTPVDFTITSDDLESGVASIHWQLDAKTPQSQTFSNTLNLVQNPSFEDSGSPIDKWEQVNDDQFVVFSQDSTAAPSFGSNSAKIVATTGTWNAFSNRTNFAVATPHENMTSSVWVKTSSVTQEALYKVYVVYDAGGGTQATTLIGTSSSVSGTTGWQKLSYNFTANHDDAIGVYTELGIKGSGTVWFDGSTITTAFTTPTANFVISSNGQHVLAYYSKDNVGNEELPHQTFTFKLDTKAPSRWTNFTLTQSGNDHTYIVSIKVSDLTSGLDISTAEYQYSVDQGATWGYYSDPLRCNSTFQTNQWSQTSNSPSTDGSTTTTMTTPAIDFCNNNWADTKYIRFRIRDMAGNSSQSGDFAINGSWIQVVNGDIFSNENISMQANSTASFLVGADESISNLTSGQSWFMDDYDELPYDSYDKWYERYQTTTSLPSGKLPTESGRFFVDGDFTIATSTIPNNLSTTANLSAVIFVNGDLIINNNYSLLASSGIIFIVKGDVTTATGVSAFDGFFITDGLFDLGSGNTQITIAGGVQADEFNLKRSLSGGQNQNSPAEIFTYSPKYLIVGKNQLTGNVVVTWLGTN